MYGPRKGSAFGAVKSLRAPAPILGATELRVAEKIRAHMAAVQFRQMDIFHRCATLQRDAVAELPASSGNHARWTPTRSRYSPDP